MKALFLSLAFLVSAMATTASAKELTVEEIAQLRTDLRATLLAGEDSRVIGNCTLSYDQGYFKIESASQWIRMLLTTDNRKVMTAVDESKGEMQVVTMSAEKRVNTLLKATPNTSPVFTSLVIQMEEPRDVNVGTATNPKIVKQWKPTDSITCK